MNIKEEFAGRLRLACQDHWKCPKPNQKEMAAAFNVSQATVSDWMNAIKMPGLEKLIEISLTLNVCLEWLGTGRGPKNPPCHHQTSANLSDEQKEMLRKITDLVCL